MAHLTLTTSDPHDTLTRVLGIFRLMDLPLGSLTVTPVQDLHRIAIAVADDDALIESLVARFARLVSVEAVALEGSHSLRAAAA